jgi:hypothetical protein
MLQRSNHPASSECESQVHCETIKKISYLHAANVDPGYRPKEWRLGVEGGVVTGLGPASAGVNRSNLTRKKLASRLFEAVPLLCGITGIADHGECEAHGRRCAQLAAFIDPI